MKQYLNVLLATLLTVSTFTSANVVAQDKNVWDKAYNNSTKERFIPVELFTGGQWDGKHELVLKEATTTSCAAINGNKRRCDNYDITGPFKTEKNNTKIEWVGDEIPYYRRTFSTRRHGLVESFFTINSSKDGLVRIYDKRKKWGARTYSGVGNKFPLGNWKQGEVRVYDTRRPTKIEIIELNGPDNCLTFRWTLGLGKERNTDNNYTYCPNRGFTNITHNYQAKDSKK